MSEKIIVDGYEDLLETFDTYSEYSKKIKNITSINSNNIFPKIFNINSLEIDTFIVSWKRYNMIMIYIFIISFIPSLLDINLGIPSVLSNGLMALGLGYIAYKNSKIITFILQDKALTKIINTLLISSLFFSWIHKPIEYMVIYQESMVFQILYLLLMLFYILFIFLIYKKFLSKKKNNFSLSFNIENRGIKFYLEHINYYIKQKIKQKKSNELCLVIKKFTKKSYHIDYELIGSFSILLLCLSIFTFIFGIIIALSDVGNIIDLTGDLSMIILFNIIFFISVMNFFIIEYIRYIRKIQYIFEDIKIDCENK